ncbi:MAG TPA: FecR domain-containing protein [Pyrinomonadaceae bacterium]|nr:FecR domain-containing protein [Pyrinomonadaceae bacterium]
MRLASFVSVLALCVCLLGNGCSKEITRSTVPVVFFVRGKVVFGNAERNDFKTVTPKSKIHAGDIVRTSDGASINLGLIPGAFIQLSGNSEIKIEDLRLTKNGNETAERTLDRRGWIRLNRGRIVTLFKQSDKTASDFGVTTSQITLKPDSDSLFSVWTDDTTSRVTSVRGEVSASADAQPPLKITAGYFSQWPTASKEPIAASADANAQLDIKAALDVEPELLDQAAGW